MSRKIFKIMKISAKIKNLRESLNLNREDFALKIGVNPKTISFWENDVNEPTKSKLLTICNICNLPEDYFEEDVINDVIVKTSNSDEPTIEGDYYPDVFGSCGSGAFVLSETKEKIKIPEKCFIKPISRVKKYSVINASGNSMSPYIYDRDRLIVEHFEQGDRIQDDKVYVFCYDEQIMVKRLYYNVDEIIVKSDNPDPIFKVKYISKENMDRLIIIGQIVGLMRDCR